MKDYKLRNEEGTSVFHHPTALLIQEGSGAWKDYQQWLAGGNNPDPWKTFPELKGIAINDNKEACKQHILSFYSLEIQSSMSLGVYTSEDVSVMTVFIAECIEEENRVHDLLYDATNETELDSITANYPDPIFPL